MRRMFHLHLQMSLQNLTSCVAFSTRILDIVAYIEAKYAPMIIIEIRCGKQETNDIPNHSISWIRLPCVGYGSKLSVPGNILRGTCVIWLSCDMG